MVGSKEAERMGYREYKIAVWTRLVAFWVEQSGNPVHRPEFVAARLHACRAHLAIWQPDATHA